MDTVNPNATIDTKTGCRPIISQIVAKTHVFNTNLQKKLLLEYDLQSKIKSQEYAKLTTDKKALITIICGQYNGTTMTKLALGTKYAANCDAGNLINFLQRSKVICYESNDGSLSHKPYKITIAVESLHNYTNSKPNNPHRFKEELKIKYESTLAIVGKFPNRTGVMEQLLKVDGNKTWIDYWAMTPAN